MLAPSWYSFAAAIRCAASVPAVVAFSRSASCAPSRGALPEPKSSRARSAMFRRSTRCAWLRPWHCGAHRVGPKPNRGWRQRAKRRRGEFVGCCRRQRRLSPRSCYNQVILPSAAPVTAHFVLQLCKGGASARCAGQLIGAIRRKVGSGEPHGQWAKLRWLRWETFDVPLGLFVAIRAFHHFDAPPGFAAAARSTPPIAALAHSRSEERTTVMTFGPPHKGAGSTNLARRCFLRCTGTLRPLWQLSAKCQSLPSHPRSTFAVATRSSARPRRPPICCESLGCSLMTRRRPGWYLGWNR
jgi:hypothetical protein